jgi:hypothetical protein
MLTFDDRFVSDGGIIGCVLLWADEPRFERVRFTIRSVILQCVLRGANAVHDEQNVALCENERPQIEAACRGAFAKRPSANIDLSLVDFANINLTAAV